MNQKSWQAHAPSNIALIKYMGKKEFLDSEGKVQNIPSNASFSYTLNHLKTSVEVKLDESLTQDEWRPLTGSSYRPLELSPKGKERYLNHWKLLKNELNLPGFYLIQSSNNFPSDCGLASSASSFAALTKAAAEVGESLGNSSTKGFPANHSPAKNSSTKDSPLYSVNELAQLSRRGSGSSCRSFFSPWALWKGTSVEPVETLPYDSLMHQVAVVSSRIKKVSSSEAHTKVASSLLFSGRVERAETRLEKLFSALSHENWKEAYEIVWAEFWDMQTLFETSSPSFGYMTPDSIKVLQEVRKYWEDHGDGPLVTMDAGPNVHLLYRLDQSKDYSQLGSLLKNKGVSLLGGDDPK